MQNTGNLCQKLFDRPRAFAKMLGIPVYYVQHFQTILAVLSSKKALLDPMGFKAFCDGHLDEKFKNERTKWNHHNTTGDLFFHETKIFLMNWYNNQYF